MRTPITSILLVLLASFIGSFGAVFLKIGAAKLKGGLRYLFLNPALIAGVVLFVLSSVAFVLGIRHGELTILYPLVSLSNLWTVLWSRIYFKEPLTGEKLMGLGLILSGAVCIGLGNR